MFAALDKYYAGVRSIYLVLVYQCAKVIAIYFQNADNPSLASA